MAAVKKWNGDYKQNGGVVVSKRFTLVEVEGSW